MEWPNQITELQRQWVEQQQQLLNDWLGTLQNAGGSATPNAWREAIDVIEQQVNNALDAQKQSLKALVENTAHVEGVPEPITHLVHQLEDGIELWSDVQLRLWQVWFDMLRTSAPAPQTPAESLISNWQDMAQQAMSIQEQWLSNWTGQTAASGKPRKKTPKSSAP